MNKAGDIIKAKPWGELAFDAPTPEDLAFLARQLVQCTLPHRDPGDVPIWSRTNGELTLLLSRTDTDRNGKMIGYPYGSLPRLLLYWLNSEAVKTKSPRLQLGNSLGSFLKDLGLSRETGRGKRGDAKRLHEQMLRLFSTAVRFKRTRFAGDQEALRAKLMPIVSESELWWRPRQPNQDDLWESWIELGHDFFKAITQSAVPLDTRVLREIKRSPLALDLYSWLSYTSFVVTKKKESREIPWEKLHAQMGADYTDIKDFKKKAMRVLRRIVQMDPKLRIEPTRDGYLIVHPAAELSTTTS